MATLLDNKNTDHLAPAPTAETETNTTARSTASAVDSSLVYATTLMVGTFLGILFTKSEVVRWQRVHEMFLFQDSHLYLIIGSGVAVAMLGMAIIRKCEASDIYGKPIQYKPKPFHKGVALGGMSFGAGWAITGACPGPIYAQLGSGVGLAGFTYAGVLVGMYLYAWAKPHLPH